MNISIEELQKAAAPLIELLQKKGTPMIAVLVTSEGADLFEAVIGMEKRHCD